MKPNFLEAASIIRRVAEEHLVDECGHLHGHSASTQAIVRFLLRTGDAEYVNMLDPYGSGAVFQQEIKLREERAAVPSPGHPIETAPPDDASPPP